MSNAYHIALPIQTDKDKHFTVDQWKAIHQEGTNILVSASAGSGKTTVLTRRIIEKIKKGVNINELLVVTFTDAATHDMRLRIQNALEKEESQTTNPHVKEFLQKQLTLLPQANISTIHAFCSKLIKEYFQYVHVDPNFKLLTDAIEIDIMKEQVFTQLKEELYDDDSFRQLVKSYAKKENDSNVTTLVIKLYDFSRSKENPKQWLNDLPCLYDVENLSTSRLYKQLILPYIKQIIEECLLNSEQIIHLIKDLPSDSKSYQLLCHERLVIKEIYELVNNNSSYTIIYKKLKNIKFERLNFKKSELEYIDKEQIKNCRDNIKDQIKNLRSNVFFTTEEKQVELLKLTQQNVKTLAQVVIQFQKRYELEKRSHNVLDYNDLEHLALEVLAPLQEDNSRQLSAVATYYQSFLKEVMVDEYQDVNRLQEGILSRLSNGKNMFMVGDVKQSIYAFRLADPSLFQNKYDAYKRNDGGSRILLKENFRSRENVLHMTNFLFMQLMDLELGQMVYDDDAMMVQGNTNAYPNEKDVDVSVLIYERETSNDDNESLEKFDSEIKMVAHKISELISNKVLVTECYNHQTAKHEQRNIQYSDISILLPTKKNNLRIKEIFEKYHIPVVIQEAETFFKRTEIMIILSLLRVIDNPYQDIPLVSVLRSPIVNVGENELAAIRINERTDNYYNALKRFVTDYANNSIPQNSFNDALYNKLVIFLEQLKQWRLLSTQESLTTLIWTIYTDTLFLDFVGGLSNATQRQANLHALYEHAKSYENTRFKGLFQFVSYIEKMQQKEKDLAEPSVVNANQNAVSVSTIHASKGLEYPYVFLCDLTKQFNMPDIKGDYIFEEDYGIGTYYFDTIDRWKYSTLALEGIKQYKQRKLFAEEMRKLYVALTRAKEKLFLVGSTKSKEHLINQMQQVSQHQSTVLPIALRAKSNVTMFDWIIIALSRHSSVQTFSTILPVENDQLPQNLNVSYEFFNKDNLNNENIDNTLSVEEWYSQQNEEQLTNNDMYKKMFDNMHKVATYQYDKMIDTKTTSYQSVSELKRLVEDPSVVELSKQVSEQPIYRYVDDGFEVPQFMQPNITLTSAQIGTATHLILQKIDLTQNITLQIVQSTIQQLVNRQLIHRNVAVQIDELSIVKFYQTDFGQFLKQHADQIKTEVPLSLLVNAKQLFPEVSDESSRVLIHGIVDGYIELEDGIIVYDYKTDNVKRQGLDNIIKRYKSQLMIYAQALSSALNKPVLRIVLCLLQTGDNVDIDYY